MPGENAARIIREHASPDGCALFLAIRVAGFTMIDPRTVELYESAHDAARRLGLLAVAEERGLDWERSLQRLGRGPEAPLTIVRLGRTFIVTRESINRFIEQGGLRRCS